MSRLLARLTIGIVMILVVAVGAATIAGRGIHTKIVTVVTNPVRTVLGDEMDFRLIDLNRGLPPVMVPLPVQHGVEVQLHPDGYALIMSRVVGTDYSQFGLHYYDLNSHELYDLVKYHDESGQPRFSGGSLPLPLDLTFRPIRSPDGSMFAFIDPVGKSLNVYSLETARTLLRYPPATSWIGLAWSPDSTQLAFREFDDTLVILNIDGTNIREFRRGPGLPMWSPDGQWLMMGFYNNPEATSIRIVDAMTGELHPYFSKDIVGTSTSWSCDGRWISYLNAEYQLQLVNLETNEIFAPQETRFPDVPIGRVSWLPDCQHMLIIGTNVFREEQPFVSPPATLYLVDTQTMGMQLLAQDTWFPDSTENNAVYYYEIDLSNKLYSLYRWDINTQDSVKIASLPDIQYSQLNVLDRTRGIYMSHTNQQLLVVDFATGVASNLFSEELPVYSYVTWETG